MKGWLLIIVLLLACACYAQENLGDPDSLKIKLSKAPTDTSRVLLLCDIASVIAIAMLTPPIA